MRRTRFGIMALTAAGGLLLSAGSVPAETEVSRRAEATLQVALHYDFFGVEGSRISDAAANKHAGILQNGTIVSGKRKPAVRLDGTGTIIVSGSPDELSVARKAFSVGALCRPASPNGVVVAMGDERDGFSLYLKDGVPQFAIRSAGNLTSVAADEPVVLEQWVHLLGVVNRKGQMQLVVNGWPVATRQGQLIAKTPQKPLSIGLDSSGPVGSYAGPLGWHGLLEDVRLYWGVVDRNEHRDELGDWADLPGCGCKK